jgi:carboxylesterase type B
MGLSDDDGMPERFPILARQIMPTASNQTIAALQSQYDYSNNPPKLAWDWTTDVIFACNAYNLARAYANKAYRYIMSIPPATHAQDVLCKLNTLVSFYIEI